VYTAVYEKTPGVKRSVDTAGQSNLFAISNDHRQSQEICRRMPSAVCRRSFAMRTVLRGSLPASGMRQSKAMAGARKPVIVRKFSRDWCVGYAGAALEGAELEILDTTGKVLRIAWEQVKWVCFVRDLSAISADAGNPERLLHKRFSVRPRAVGVWLRMTLTDGDEIEGIAANDLSLVTGAGLLLTPPDTRSNTQRIFVPRAAMQRLEVVSLIGANRRPAERGTEQSELFDSGT
jgi:hypothetical protein